MQIPRLAILLGGVAVGIWAGRPRSSAPSESTPGKAASPSTPTDTALQRLDSQQMAISDRLKALETRVDQHDVKLKEVPSAAQVVTAMEEMLATKMNALDQRISAQVRSIEVLKMTVSQTDELLEQLLESLDSLRQSSNDGHRETVGV